MTLITSARVITKRRSAGIRVPRSFHPGFCIWSGALARASERQGDSVAIRPWLSFVRISKSIAVIYPNDSFILQSTSTIYSNLDARLLKSCEGWSNRKWRARGTEPSNYLIYCWIPKFRHVYEQRAIATVLSDMDAEIAALERRRDKTNAVKQGMMQQLLTGRVRLVQPEMAAEQTAGS